VGLLNEVPEEYLRDLMREGGRGSEEVIWSDFDRF